MMNIMTMWLPDPASITRPAYRSLARAVVAAIDSGALRPGDRLPTHRELAFRLGLSVQTVSRAYEALIRADVIAGEVGRGTYVKSTGPDGRAPPYQRLEGDEPVVDCSMLMPVLGEPHRTALDRALADLSGDVPSEVLGSFRPRRALRKHVERARGWLSLCGIDARPDRILPTNGATPAMTVALLSAAAPGDLVVTEVLGHHTLKSLTQLHGLKLEGLACDVQGILPEALDRAARKRGARVLYVLPSGNNACAATMDAERRAEIVAVARRHDMLIVENDAWGPLEPRRPAPLAMLAPERVFYFTALSKCLMPALRTGWLVVPDSHVTAAFSRHMVTNWMASPLVAELSARLIERGEALELLRWQRRALARRNIIARQLLDGLDMAGGAHGLHVWLTLSDGWDEAGFVRSARLRGVAIAPGSAFETGNSRPRPQGVRICLGAPDERGLRDALTVIARLARNRPEPDFLTL
ncbi:MAG: putative transcriptional regulator [Rhodobacteraceae bacterium HLUCCA12]|nr:MAG: putative transcriptional regulator [Rhodobacteraceae bacterium HLUCCA12]